MQPISFRFHAELNDFLPPHRRDRTFEHQLPERASVKDVIESLGVPHPEVAHIVVNDQAVSFAYIVRPGDQIVVHPTSTSQQLTPESRLRPSPTPRFILDVHLGRLAEYLRMLGFDTLYRNDYDDPELARISATEQRILLTRDIGLLKRGVVVHGYYVRETDPQRQVIEIMRRFDFFDHIQPLQRCSHCNGQLQPVDKVEVADQLLPQTRNEHELFHRCLECGQIYWKGSHYARLQQFIADVQRQKPSASP